METYLDISVSSKIEFCKTANISPPRYVNCEIMKKVDDGRRTFRERKPENEGCQDDRDKLLDEYKDFHSEQFSKFLVDLL